MLVSSSEGQYPMSCILIRIVPTTAAEWIDINGGGIFSYLVDNALVAANYFMTLVCRLRAVEVVRDLPKSWAFRS